MKEQTMKEKELRIIRLGLYLGAAFLLFLPLLLRLFAGDPLIAGAASYEQLATLPSLGEPYTLFLTLFNVFGDFVVLLSPVLGLLSLWLFERLVGKERFFVTLLFVLNPLFLSLFTSLSLYTIGIPLSLLLLLNRERRPFFFLVALTAWVAPLFTFLVVAGLSLFRRKSSDATALVIAAFFLLLKPGFFVLTRSTGGIIEFGSPYGLSVLFLSFALIEGLLEWTEGEGRVLFISLLFLFFVALFLDAGLLLLGFLSVFFVAQFVARLFYRKWSVEELRILTLVLLFCSFLFLLIIHVGSLVAQEPSAEMIALLEPLPADAGLLGPPELAPIVGAFSNASYIFTPQNCPDFTCSGAEVLSLSQLSKTRASLDQLGVSHILITEEMRSGRVWTRDEVGLLFFLKHSIYFTLVAQTEEAELWAYSLGE